MLNDIQIKKSRRKSLGVYVRNAQVEVRAPLHLSDSEIHHWLSDKSDWIQQKIAEQQQKKNEQPRIEHGEQLPFLGQHLTLEFIHGKPALHEGHQRLTLSLQKNSNPVKLIENWLKQEASLYITDRTHELATLMQDSDRLTGIQFRKTKSKWGHCTSHGKLQFNWLIMMAPPEVIDYLIIHELSHLRHMNHSKRFWQRVEKFCPDYKAHKRWLNDNGHRLWLANEQ